MDGRRENQKAQLVIGGGEARPKNKIGRRPHMYAADYHEFANWMQRCEDILGGERDILVTGRVPNLLFHWANGWTPEAFCDDFCR